MVWFGSFVHFLYSQPQIKTHLLVNSIICLLSAFGSSLALYLLLPSPCCSRAIIRLRTRTHTQTAHIRHAAYYARTHPPTHTHTPTGCTVPNLTALHIDTSGGGGASVCVPGQILNYGESCTVPACETGYDLAAGSALTFNCSASGATFDVQPFCKKSMSSGRKMQFAACTVASCLEARRKCYIPRVHPWSPQPSIDDFEGRFRNGVARYRKPICARSKESSPLNGRRFSFSRHSLASFFLINHRVCPPLAICGQR